jgi:hypothetical protein
MEKVADPNLAKLIICDLNYLGSAFMDTTSLSTKYDIKFSKSMVEGEYYKYNGQVSVSGSL